MTVLIINPNKPIPRAANKIIVPKRPAFERFAKSHMMKHIKRMRPPTQIVSAQLSNSSSVIVNLLKPSLFILLKETRFGTNSIPIEHQIGAK